MTTHVEEAKQIAKGYAGWAAGAGLIPVPLVDIAGVTAAQIAMIHKIADLYKVSHNANRVKTIIASLVGGVGSYGIAAGSMSIAKAVPFVGSLLGIALMPAAAVATTIALADVFILHFESGGTLLDFDVERMAEKFQEARAAAAQNAGHSLPGDASAASCA